MLICCATMRPLEVAIDLPTVRSWLGMSAERPRIHFIDNSKANLGLVRSYQKGYEDTTELIIAYFHDDVEIREPDWDRRVLREFEDPTVGIVGFGGAVRLGSHDLYKRPYDFRQLARFGYRSNAVDAEIHGARFEGECDVAVLDGYAIIVRRELLAKAGGWPVGGLQYHMYDAWLACAAARLGYRTRLVGVKCQHYGGGTSVQGDYEKWLRETQSKTDADVHREAHEWLYDHGRDCLPLEVR